MANLQITLAFNEGTNPPKNMRNILILEKSTRRIHRGWFNEFWFFYKDSLEDYRRSPAEVMWAEMPEINL